MSQKYRIQKKKVTFLPFKNTFKMKTLKKVEERINEVVKAKLNVLQHVQQRKIMQSW